MNDSSLAKTLDRWWSRLRFRVSGFAGRLLNLAGLPGFIRHGQTYEFAGIKVRTTVGRWSTTVLVNDVRVRFYRLTGEVSAIGVSSPSPSFLSSLNHRVAECRTDSQPNEAVRVDDQDRSCGKVPPRP